MQSRKSHKCGLLEEQEKGAQKAVEKFDRSERSSTPASENPACKIPKNTKKEQGLPSEGKTLALLVIRQQKAAFLQFDFAAVYFTGHLGQLFPGGGRGQDHIAVLAEEGGIFDHLAAIGQAHGSAFAAGVIDIHGGVRARGQQLVDHLAHNGGGAAGGSGNGGGVMDAHKHHLGQSLFNGGRVLVLFQLAEFGFVGNQHILAASAQSAGSMVTVTVLCLLSTAAAAAPAALLPKMVILRFMDKIFFFMLR